MSIPAKPIYKFNAILLYNLMVFFNRKKIKVYRKSQKATLDKTILGEKNKAEGLTLPDIKICYKVRVIKTVW